jgi:cyclophilin family peptidyl-prolyl cis-trans isomerase/HEAT repeat protein
MASMPNASFRPVRSLIFAALAWTLCSTLGLATDALAGGSDTGGAALLDVPASQQSIAWSIIDAENHRLPDAEALTTGVAHANANVRILALQALGRIGAPSRLALVASTLKDANVGVRKMAAFAAGMIGTAEGVTALKAAYLEETDSTVRGEMALAIGRAGTIEDLGWLEAVIRDQSLSVEARGRAAQGFGLMFLRLPAGTLSAPETLTALTSLATSNAQAAIPSAFALARYSGAADEARLQELIAGVKAARNPEARGFLTRALGRTKADLARVALVELLSTETAPAVRVDVARTLVNFGAHADVIPALVSLRTDRSSQVRAQANMTLEQLGPDAVAAKETLVEAARTDGSSWVRSTALTALAAVSPDDARPLVTAAIGNAWPANSAALSAATYLGRAEDLLALLGHLQAESLAEAATAAGAAAGFADELLDEHARAPFLAALSRPDLALTSIVAEAAGRRAWKEFALPLTKAYATFTRPDDVEVKVAVITALGLLGEAHADVLAVLRTALADDERSVSQAAADAIKALTDTDVSDQVPASSIVHAETPSIGELRAAATSRLVVRTTRGRFLLQMNPAAPLTAHNIVKLAKDGFYSNLTMHRVVPHFVAQGGDPRGDGYGGPGYVIRDEVSLTSHNRGAVGIATAGKDTGGCQFFVDHGSNLHLDGAYTVFAQVVAGIEVVDALEQGDTIVSVTRLKGH